MSWGGILPSRCFHALVARHQQRLGLVEFPLSPGALRRAATWFRRSSSRRAVSSREWPGPRAASARPRRVSSRGAASFRGRPAQQRGRANWGCGRNRRPASVGSLGKPVRDGQLVAAGGRFGVGRSLHGFPQSQGALVLLDRRRRVSQVQVARAQQLRGPLLLPAADPRTPRSTFDSAIVERLMQRDVLALAAGPEGLR